MSELNLISPLLDGMEVLECICEHGGTACYLLSQAETEERFVLKRISIPASETKTQALLLTGAVKDEASAQAYYEEVANDIRREVIKLQSLSGHSSVASWSGYQVEPREGIGFDVYLLMPYRSSLRSFLEKNALTQLQALNFGIDLCNALSTVRDAGYIFLNLKPENIFVDSYDHYMIGDLGILPLQDLSYCALPEDYLSDFSAPELYKLIPEPNETSDLYSLGLVLYYIFNGNHLPFDDGKVKPERARQQRLRGDALPTPAYADYELAEIIAKACAPEPEQRWASPAELRQALILYMQRNDVSDQLLVPPLPLEEEAPAEEESPGEAPAEQDAEAEAAPVEEAPAEEEAPMEAEPALEEAAPEAESPEAEPPAEEAPAEDTPAEEEAEEGENLSLDELLASVNDVLRQEEEPAVAEAPDLEANEAAQKEQPQKRKKRVWIPITIVLLLLSALGAVLAYFYFNWYLVTMSGLTVVERSDDSIVVSYSLSAPDPDLSWQCTDTYGNSFPGIAGEDMVSFLDLTPGMQYTIEFYPGKLHNLRGERSISAATQTQTQIVSLAAGPGGNSTTVEVSMVVSGPEPEEWILTWSSTGSDSGTIKFSGHSVLIPGLKLHESYTFELLAPEGIYLDGQTQCEMSTIADVAAENLRVVSATQSALSVAWDSLADAPKTWQVSCVGEGYDKTLELTECAATFTGINLQNAYTFTLSAEGLDIPLSVSLPANATVITAFDAEPLDAGSVELTWTCAEPVPETGWRVRSLVGGSEALSRIQEVPEGNTMVLTGLPPKAEVVVQLQAANGDALIGAQSLTVMMPEAAAFDKHDFVPADSSLQLYALPEQEDWGYDDLGDALESCDPAASLAVVLQAPEEFKKNDSEETAVTLVLRAQSGKVVLVEVSSCTWKDLWRDGRYLSSLKLPDAPESYQAELYFDNLFVASAVITTAAPDTPETE